VAAGFRLGGCDVVPSLGSVGHDRNVSGRPRNHHMSIEFLHRDYRDWLGGFSGILAANH